MLLLIYNNVQQEEFIHKGDFYMSEYTIGFLIGFSVVILIFLIIAIVLKCKNNHATEYDERQLISRNAAYKYAFSTLVCYCVLCGIIDVAEIRWAETAIQMFLGMFLSVTVFVVICIFKDAYFRIEKEKNNIRTFLFLSVLITIIQFFSFILNVFVNKEPIITNGILNISATNLLCAVAFLIMIIATVIKLVLIRKEREEE